MADRDLLLTDTGEMIIRNGGFATGDSLTQEVGLLLLTCKGEIRHDLFCGCDLVKRMNTRIGRTEFERIVKVQIARDGKNWPDVKDGINLRTNG